MAISYGKKFKELYVDLLKSDVITVDDKRYRELINVIYELPFDEEVLGNTKIRPDKEADVRERMYLMYRLDECVNLLKNDIHSRRAAFCNLYNNEMGKCITTVHVFVRGKKVYINEYYRSQEAFRNFSYDWQTACLIMEKMTRVLKLTPGKITVFVASFHKTIKKKI